MGNACCGKPKTTLETKSKVSPKDSFPLPDKLFIRIDRSAIEG